MNIKAVDTSNVPQGQLLYFYYEYELFNLISVKPTESIENFYT